MSEIIQCPKCQRQLRVPEELRGRSVKCPSCGEMFAATASPPPAEESAGGVMPSESTRPAPPPPPSPYESGYPDDPRRFAHYAPHRGTMVLVLGILGLVFGILGVILGPIAWIMGNNDLAEIQAGRMDPAGEGMTQAGRICGIIATILGGLGLACCFLYMIIIAGAMAGGAR